MDFAKNRLSKNSRFPFVYFEKYQEFISTYTENKLDLICDHITCNV